MRKLRAILMRLAGLFKRGQSERDLADEIESNLQFHIDDNVRSGMKPGEARRAALIKFGSVEAAKAEWRDRRSIPFIEVLARDFAYSWRTLRQNKGWAIVVVGTLALSIGASAAVFSVVNSVIFKSLPYRDPDRLAVLLHRQNEPTSPADYLFWKKNATSFDELAAAEAWQPNLTGHDRPELIRALRGTANLFTLLGVQPLLGRTFIDGDDATAAERVVVLSHGLWQRRFGGEAGTLDRVLTLDGHSYRVIGIMPPGFEFPLFWFSGAELWAPLKLESRAEDHARSLRVFGRLSGNTTFFQAQSEMSVIAGQLERVFPRSNTDLPISVFTHHERVVGDVRLTLVLVLAGVGFVLLICCANVANMFLARASVRQREIGLRLALGAHRSRIVRQLMTDAALAVTLGGIIGLGLAYWSLRIFTSNLAPEMLPRQEAISLDGTVIFFAISLCFFTTMGSGLLPALRASRTDLNSCMKEGGRGGSDAAAGAGMRKVLVIAEIALALVLLIGAGLMFRTFLALQRVDAGFNPDNLLTMTVSVAGTAQSHEGRRIAFYDTLIERMGALPGVQSVSAINHLPLYGDRWVWPIAIEGKPASTPADSAVYRVVRPGYFRTMHATLAAGRDFTELDRLDSQRVVIVNEALAQKHWPGMDAVGRRIHVRIPEAPWMTVIGVVKDVKNSDWREEAEPEMYMPFLQSRAFMREPATHYSYMTIVARTESEPAALAEFVKDLVWQIEPNAPISSVLTMDEIVSRLLARSRVPALLLGVFAGVAMILAAVGIYGLMSYTVTIRKPEIGIRMTLGAHPAAVLRLVLRDGLKLTVCGIAAGVAGALGLTRLISTLLFNVAPTDPLVFAAVTVFLIAFSLAACVIPAIRAARVDPIESLRLL